jgi:cytochrome P450
MAATVDPGAGLAALVASYQRPHELYDLARSRGGVAFDPSSKCWLVTDHSAARAILGDPQFSSELKERRPSGSRPGTISFLQAAIERQILFSDGDEHLHVQRAILHETATRSRELSGTLERLAEELVAPLVSRGELDLVTDFALPYALRTSCMVMGIPTDDPYQLSRLAEWSSTYADVTSGHLSARVDHITKLGDYFRSLVAHRKAVALDDVIAVLLRDRVFSDEQDLVVNCMVVFSAGRVTTQKLLGDGIAHLLPHWEQWRALAGGDPGICRRLTEELLRFVTPTRYLARRATCDVAIALERGSTVRIAAGEKVIVFLEAANRDPATFPDPHELHADRHPNPHLAFGHGSHRCPGASVARLEIQVALRVLFDRFATLRPHPARARVWDPNPNLGGLTSCPCLCS